jgi:hypothetical protein
MKIVVGDIWSTKYDWPVYRVIPTNIGWKMDGSNVMGRGVAAQAAKLYPELAKWYGERCQRHWGDVGLRVWKNLVLFPVKPLNEEQPQLSWRQPADLDLVDESIVELKWFLTEQEIVLPMVGCGNGELDPMSVLPILKRYLSDDRFTLVIRPQDYDEAIRVWVEGGTDAKK